MNFSREKIIETLEKVLAADNFRKFHFAEKYTGKKRVQFGCSFTFPRLTFVMDGLLQLNVGSGEEVFEADYAAGDTLVMKPYCITGEKVGPASRDACPCVEPGISSDYSRRP